MADAPIELPALIGVSGYADSGKDSVAHYLIEQYAYHRVAFADRLKGFVYALFPEIAAQVNELGWDYAKKQNEVRQAIQNVGKALKSHVHPDALILPALVDLKLLDGQRVVVSDVRFPNEADTLIARGGIVIRVNRPGVGPVNGDESETALDRYDQFSFVLNNDSDLAALHLKVEAMLTDAQQTRRGVSF
jgi:hypothetical protein